MTKTERKDLKKVSEGKLLIQKLLVGHFIEDVPDDFNKKVAYVWQGDGVWEVRNLPIGTFTNRICDLEVPGLKKTMKVGWKLNVPKIPAVLLDVTLSFFRKIYSEHSSEVFLQYFYEPTSEKYTLHCPQQAVGPGSVNYRRDLDYEKGKILVFEIHSHGSMPAFFSGTDNADEKDDRFFGVIGHVKDYYPELKIRLSIGGRKQNIDVEDIFNLSESSYNKESFPVEWVNRIKEKKVKVVSSSGRRNGNGMRRRPSRSGAVYYPAENQLPLEIDDPSIPHTLYGQDNDYEEIQCSGIKEDQKLVEKDGQIYIVTDNGDEEIWEPIETKEVEYNGKNRGNGDGKDKIEDQTDEEYDDRSIYDWRNFRW